MPFACIYVPNFSVAAALRAEPELQARTLAIVEGKPPLEKIFAVNEAASRLGIAPGMTKAQAELCPEVALRPRSALQESAAHAALLDCAQSFSPCVEDSSCDTVLLDLAGMESLMGSLPEISRAVSHRAATLGLAANVAVASNPDAAALAARGLCGVGTFARAGVTVIPAGQEAERLGPLPVEVLFANSLAEDRAKDRKKPQAFTRNSFARNPFTRNSGPLGHTKFAGAGGAAGNCLERTPRAGRPAPAATGARRGFAHAGAGGSAAGV